MKTALLATVRPAVVLFAVLTLICGVLYPYFITGISQIVFPKQANGSLIEQNGQLIGSTLIGQAFTARQYFWGRPSTTTPQPDNAAASGGSNLGPTNSAQLEAVKNRVLALKAADPTNTAPIPVDLVTASASGLDPEISLAAAYYQAARVARARKLTIARVRNLIDAHKQLPWLGFLGEARVNVLELNLALDQIR